jgi:hypothetical protein
MIDLRNALWGSALLVAFVGCNNTEEPAGTTTPAPPPTLPGAPGGNAPAAPADKPKDDMPPPAKPDDAKTDAPKDGDDVKLEAPKAAAPKEDAPPKKDEDKKADASPAKETLSAEELAEIQKLPASEKEIALAQIVCPVSGEHLGSMGKPIKQTAEGKTFLICCKGCTEDIAKDPKAVVAKLNKK